jgi:hypothetical protein
MDRMTAPGWVPGAVLSSVVEAGLALLMRQSEVGHGGQ